MKIKEVVYQYRRDFRAIYICEHCRYEYTGSGYDDANFHENVIPSMKCEKCGEKSPSDYVPRATKYASYEVV